MKSFWILFTTFLLLSLSGCGSNSNSRTTLEFTGMILAKEELSNNHCLIKLKVNDNLSIESEDPIECSKFGPKIGDRATLKLHLYLPYIRK